MAFHPFQQNLTEQLYDAILVVDAATHTVVYRNPAATTLLSDDSSATLPELLLIYLKTLKPPYLGECILPAGTLPMIACNTLVRSAGVIFDDKDAVVLSLIPSDELVDDEQSVYRQILEETHFLLVTIDAQTMQTTVLQSVDPLFSAVKRFPSFAMFAEAYADYALHPDDVSTFVTAFSEASCKRFLQGATAPSVTLRCLADGDHRWANYGIIRLNRNTLLLRCYYTDPQRQQECSAHYQRALESLSQRNEHILSGISDIFRLMLHIDLQSHATLVCSMHKSLQGTLSYDIVYPFEAIAEVLLSLVHPEDVKMLRAFTDLSAYHKPLEEDSPRIHVEYRRLTPSTSGGQDTNPKWTRSVIQFIGKKGQIPTAAIYAVQDVNEQKKRELQAQRQQDDLKRKFDLLIQSRFLCFIDSDYQTKVSECYRIENGEVSHHFTCPFAQIFEKGFIPHCHPDDIKQLAKTFLPEPVMAAAAAGQRQRALTYRFRHHDTWIWVRADMYMRYDDDGGLHSMIYISDVDQETRNLSAIAEAEREQLVLRKKFGLSVEDSYLSIDEVDLEADTFYHYHLQDGNYVLIPSAKPFSQLCRTYAQKHIHPKERDAFERYFGYESILRASRDRTSKIKHQFRFDLKANGEYLWCSFAARFFRDENGKPFIMLYLENIDPEVREREQRLQELEAAKQDLQSAIRLAEQSRVRKAHFLTNITSDARLALNHICGMLEQLRENVALSDDQLEDFNSLSTACDQIEGMIENMRDVLLLENHMLPLMKEPVSLPEVFSILKEKALPTLLGKDLLLTTYTSNVINEIIYCDSTRLLHLIESIFLHIIRALPNDTKITLSLKQTPTDKPNIERFTFSLISYGDRFSRDFQESLCTPLRAISGMNALERSMFAETGQDNLNMHINKKLIALMDGTLTYEQMPDGASAVRLSIPLSVAMEPPCVFPNLHLYRKRAMLLEPVEPAAASLKEMLSETGMYIDAPTLEKAVSVLRDAASDQPFDLLILPQSLLNEHQLPPLRMLRAISPDTTFLIRQDRPATTESKLDAESVDALTIASPIFRSALARQLWTSVSVRASAPQHLGDMPNCNGKRVLLIAAKESILEQAAIAIQKSHAAVYKAWSGAQAVQMLTDAPPHFYDMALMDLQLADEITGAQILSTIRHIDREDIHSMPIYGATDQPSPKVKLLGLTDFLQKPLQHAELESLLATLATMPAHDAYTDT